MMWTFWVFNALILTKMAIFSALEYIVPGSKEQKGGTVN